MIISFNKKLELLAALKDETARHIKELSTNEKMILKVVADTGEMFDISDVECFVLNGTPRTKRETLNYLDAIFI